MLQLFVKLIYICIFSFLIFGINNNVEIEKNSIKVVYKAILKDKNFKDTESFKRAPKIVQKSFLETYKRNQQVIKDINFTLLADYENYSLTYKEPIVIVDGNFPGKSRVSASGVINADAIYTNFDDNSSVLASKSTSQIDKKVSLDDLKWELINETKTILGYKCFKAIGKLKKSDLAHAPYYPIEVWYTPNVTIKAGPTPFATLPGLILKLESPFAIINAISVKFGNYKVKKYKSKNKLMKYSEYKKYIDGWNEKNRPKPKSYYKE